MIYIDYLHNIPPSFESKLLQTGMSLFGMKEKMKNKMLTNNFVKAPANLSKSFLRRYSVQEVKQNNRKVWTIAPIEGKYELVILFLHGGAYMGNIIKQHWYLIEQLINSTNATIVVPDYPLVPEASCEETYCFIESLYTRLLNDYPDKRFVFMGDSAGGGLAFGFVQKLRNENKKQPNDVILFSPWLDLSMSNPKLKVIDKFDKILSIDGLKNAALKYAGDIDLKDYRVSPIYGNFTGLCRISIFTGAKDILNADAQKFKQLMNNQHISFNYFEYPEMFHDWIIFTGLKESSDAVHKVVKLINDYE